MQRKLSNVAVVVVVGLAAAACAPEALPRTFKLTAAQKELPADGRTATTLTAQLDPMVPGTVVTFSAQMGVLTQTVVPLKDGRATATFLPPFEAEIGAKDQYDIIVTASVFLEEGQQPMSANAKITVKPPTTGAHTIVLSAPEQRVLADGTTALTVHIAGRRMNPGDEMTLTSDPDVGLPATVALSETLEADVEIPGRTDPVAFTVTASADGASSDTLSLAFLSDDAPRYNLTGTFASISYGVVQIQGVGISPQVVSAPTIQKVTIEQTDDEIIAHYETCLVKMPIVCIQLPLSDPVASTTVPSPGFARSFPITSTPAPIRGKDLGALFQPTDETLSEAIVVGAHMEDDPDGTLPNDEADHRVWDADDDGGKGLTIHNSVLDEDSHIVVRMRTSKLAGVIRSDDEIDGSAAGSVEGSSESVILNPSFLEENLAPTITGMPGIWRAVRVDGETGDINIESNDQQPGVSCADVKQFLADPSNVLAAPSGTSNEDCAE